MKRKVELSTIGMALAGLALAIKLFMVGAVALIEYFII